MTDRFGFASIAVMSPLSAALPVDAHHPVRPEVVGIGSASAASLPPHGDPPLLPALSELAIATAPAAPPPRDGAPPLPPPLAGAATARGGARAGGPRQALSPVLSHQA